LIEVEVEVTGTWKISSWNWAMKSVGEVIDPKVNDTWVVKNSQLQY